MSLSYSNISCLMHLMVFTHVTFCIAKTSLYITNMLNVLKLNVKSQKDQYTVMCDFLCIMSLHLERIITFSLSFR